MLPEQQPLVLQKKPDDRYDTVIAVLLSFAMLAGVWHFAVKPKPAHIISKSPDLGASATVAPQACDTPATTETAPAVIHRPAETVAIPIASAVQPPPKTVPAIKHHPLVLETVKRTPVTPVTKPVPVPMHEIKPVPVVVAPTPPPVVAEVKPEVKPIAVPPPPVAEPKAAKVIVRESIEFANGSARLPPAATPRLLEIVELLRNDTRALKIVGHTDNIGSAEDNHSLSLKRAKAVMRFLVNSGVPAEHLTVEGAGFDAPIADNATEEGRKRNRRIEITEQS